MGRLRAFLLLTGVLLLFWTATAIADGPATCSFSGTVKLDENEVAGGTLITAVIDGAEYHTHTPTCVGASSYSITLRAPEGKSYRDGTKVTFKINGHDAGQTGIFKAGSSTKLDLTASSVAVASSANVWSTPLLALLLLAAFGIACFLLIRMMVGRRRLARPVTAVQAQKVVAQPRARYVWDKDKLAWVQNTKPATGERPPKVPAKSKAGVKPAASRPAAKKPVIEETKVTRFPRRDT